MKINELVIHSKNYPGQVRFYMDRLGFPVLKQDDHAVSFLAGNSVFTLIPDERATPYHIAFNIPPEQDVQALEWLKEKGISLLKADGAELVRYEAWHATAMYFYDADHNIIEYIARRDIRSDPGEPFGPDRIIGISEVGVAVSDIRDAYSSLSRIGDIPVYDGSFDKFCAAGDPSGLLILIDREQKKWFPTDDTAYSSPFILRGDISFEFNEGMIMSL